MRRVVIALLATALICLLAPRSHALFGDSNFVGQSSGGAAYQGPYNIITTNKWGGWGTMLLDSAYAGKAGNFCLVATPVTCMDIGFNTSTGDLSSSDLTTLGCSASGVCAAHCLYPQEAAGAHNLCDDGTASHRPTLTLSDVNGHACLTFNGTSQFLNYDAGLAGSTLGNFTTMIVAKVANYTPSGLTQGLFDTSKFANNDYAGGVQSIYVQPSPNYLTVLSGAASGGSVSWAANPGINTPLQITSTSSGTTLHMSVDRAAAVTASYTQNLVYADEIMISNGYRGSLQGYYFNGDVCEIAAWTADETGSTSSAAGNQCTRYGITC